LFQERMPQRHALRLAVHAALDELSTLGAADDAAAPESTAPCRNAPSARRVCLGGDARDTSMRDAEFVRRIFMAIALAALAAAAWLLRDVILLAFGAVLIAMLLRLGAEPFLRWLPRYAAMALSGLTIAAVLAGIGYLFGLHIGNELQEVVQRADDAAKGMAERIQASDLAKRLFSTEGGIGVSPSGLLTSLFSVSTAFVEALIVMLISGVYLAAQPDTYRHGLIQLFPPRVHRRAERALAEIGAALRLWLLGQLMQMVLIGLISTFAVWMIGLPSPLALGLIAGIAEFVPYIGAILASIPALLVASTKGWDVMIWTAVAYFVIHQIEGELIAPMIQRHMVKIPPALTILGIVAVYYLFGTYAVVLAAPLVIAIFIAVKQLYVRDVLGEPTELPRDGT
jgi:predicted PurR-regulated permease PerM